MEVAVSNMVVTTGRLFYGSIYSKIKRTVRFQKNVDDLEKEMKKLMELRDDVKRQLELAEIDGRSPAIKVKDWLKEVEEVELVVKSVQEDIMANNTKLCGCLFRCHLRLRLNKKVAKTLNKVEELLEAGSFPNSSISVNYPAIAVQHIPGPSIEDQTAASETLAQLMKILNDNKFHRIGVLGMGGVGKTTLVRNLNNKLKTTHSTTQSFSAVIWVTVSKELDMKRVQRQIAERLNLEVNVQDSMERTAMRLYQRLEKEEKFLLILDDVWEKIDLDSLGIPQHKDHKGSNIILTSRFSQVCRKMVTDVEVKVNVLNDNEAWKLFSQYAGEVVSLRDIKPIAEAVAQECCGLPLAIITMGSAMRGKAKVQLWKHAFYELQRSVPCIGDIKDSVYNSLKWSYDSLQSDSIKACFLYCALFPEDFSIEVSDLVQYWLAEGLIDEQHDFEDSVNTGIALLEILKDCCLLEEGARDGTVKMHDVVRDVAIWIASSLQDECKSLVRSGIGLREISEAELSNSLKRVSFMNNKINKLPDCVMQCSNASTLLLQGNFPLVKVPERFLQGFPALRVLNISGTRIQALPPSLLLMSDLRALLLGDCFFLEELPPLGVLRRLQVLDLSATRIKELPQEMENLMNLRQLNLSSTSLKTIQAGIVSKWSCLEILDMTPSTYQWGTEGEVEEGQVTFEEIGCLKRLVSLSIWLKSIPCLRPEYVTWIRRLRRFQLSIGPIIIESSLGTRHDERKVTISGLNLSKEWIGWLLINASSLVIDSCEGLNKMLEHLAINSSGTYAGINGFESFVGLKSLTITSSRSIFRQWEGQCTASCDLLPHLEEIHIYNLTYLESISELSCHLGLQFSRLKLIEVQRCNNMKCLLSYGDLVLTLPNLEAIEVRSCYWLESLFNYVSRQTASTAPIVPNLKKLELEDLPMLRTLISRSEELCLRLEHIEVIKCYLLRKLPLTIQNENTIKEIRGESHWWSELKWDSHKTESSLQQYFESIRPEIQVPKCPDNTPVFRDMRGPC